MTKFEEFVLNMANSNFYIIFLLLILLCVISVTIYALCCEFKKNKRQETIKDNFLEEDLSEINTFKVSEQEIVKEEINESVNMVEEELQMVSESIISNYEQTQEEEAIISTHELEQRLEELKARGSIEEVHNEIERYEEEQEKKAIISYDELLLRASDKVLNTVSETNDGIKVSNIDVYDVSDANEPKKSYGYQEDFLKALKEFRASL